MCSWFSAVFLSVVFSSVLVCRLNNVLGFVGRFLVRILLHLTWAPLCALLFLHLLSTPHWVHVDIKAMHILKLLPEMDSPMFNSQLVISLCLCPCVCPIGDPLFSSLEIPCVVVLVSSSRKSQIEVVVQPVSCFISSFGSFQIESYVFIQVINPGAFTPHLASY